MTHSRRAVRSGKLPPAYRRDARLVSEAIVRFRTRHGMMQNRLAAILGVSVKTLQRLERGEGAVDEPRNILRKIANLEQWAKEDRAAEIEKAMRR